VFSRVSDRVLPGWTTEPSTARDAEAGEHPDLVRVTHRFHPLSGCSFEFVKRCQTWRADRVFFFDDAGELASLPAEWTDVVPADPFVVVAAGRSPFRVADLLVLAGLAGVLGAGSGADRGSVTRILP
jgi:hypothetical protein